MSGQYLPKNTIRLDGTTFPILGAVTETAVTPFPARFATGDVSRDDNIVSSSLVLSDFSGGIGVLNAVLPRDLDRSTYSTLNTLYKYLTLLPQINGPLDLDTGGTLPGPAELFIPYNNKIYATVGSQLYLWRENTKDWTALHALSAKANSYAVHNGNLFIVTDVSLHRVTPAHAYLDYATPNPYIPSGYALIEWDSKLFRLGLDNVMYWTIDDDPDLVGDWTAAGTLPLPLGSCRQLIIFFNLDDEPVIHAITNVGVFGYDFGGVPTPKWYETPVSYPYTSTAGAGAIVYHGELFVPVGTNIYRYNRQTIQIVSPDKDEGLPPTLRGNIQSLVAGHAYYYAVLSTPVITTDTGSTMPFFGSGVPVVGDAIILDEGIGDWTTLFPMDATSANGAILVSPDTSWHGFVDQPAGSTMGAACVASVETTFRLWFSDGGGAYYVDIDTGLHNPQQNKTVAYRPIGRHETPWYDNSWSDIDKLAISLEIDAESTSPTEAIDLFVAWDGVDQWEHLATITQDGHTEIRIKPKSGRLYRRVRFAVEMRRQLSYDEDPILGVVGGNFKSPILRSRVLSFVRRPPFLWGWDMDIPATRQFQHGRTATDLINELKRIAKKKEIVMFAFTHPKSGELEEHEVYVSNVSGSELSLDGQSVGRFRLSLIQLDAEDSARIVNAG